MTYMHRGLQWLIRSLMCLETELWPTQRPSISQSVGLEQLDADQLTFVAPYFVLSTGRCGTLWLTELLRMSRYVWVNHSDHPQLIRHSRLAYEQYEQSPSVFCEVLRAARDEFMINAHKRGQVYIEANNRITFFAYAIKHVYPKSRFIHLVRHPGHFIRSGLSRNWYRGHSHDIGRIIKPGPIEVWQSMTDIEKIAWLWNETNQYIEDFLTELPEQDYVQVKAEDMFRDPSVSMKLCQFIGVDDIEPKTIAKMQTRRINQQRKWAAAPYQTWPEDQRRKVREIACIASKYGYEL